MSHLIDIELNSGERFVYVYTNVTQAQLEQDIDALMKAGQYKHLGRGVYERGSRTMRLLWGGFYKYFKFKVTMDVTDPNALKVGITKDSTGMSGGLLGVKRINDEFSRLKHVFKSL